MKRKIFSALCAFLLTVPAMHAQWVVTDPGNLAQGIVNSVNEMVETSETAQNAMSTFKEASKIYEQSRKYYDMLKSVNSLVSGSLKVKESVLMLSEISESYVTNYGKMLTDENYTQRELEAIATLLGDWQILPNGTEGYRTAEVTLGGVDTNELSSRTMEARKAPGLYFIGEVMDVTGWLGGYNFQWAWSSAWA